MRRTLALLLALGCEAEAEAIAEVEAVAVLAVAVVGEAAEIAESESVAVSADAVAGEAAASAEVEPLAVPVVAVDPEVVPAEPEAIRAWVQALAYRSWEAQSPVHATGEHGGARVFFNERLAASMAAGAGEHPIGAAGVRELYESDLSTLRGFALMVKTGPSGQAGEGWYWFEMFGTTAETRPLVAEHGSRGCIGCHAAGVDFVHPPER